MQQKIDEDAAAEVTSPKNGTDTNGEGTISDTDDKVTQENTDDDSGVSGGVVALIVILVIIVIVVVLLYVFREKLRLADRWQSCKVKLCARKTSKTSKLSMDMDQSSRQPISRPLREKQPSTQPNIDF